MDTIRIPVGKSGHALAWATIDFEDYEKVVLYRWYLNKNGYPFVAYSREMNRPTIYLHNYVLGRDGADDGMEVDHIDHDPLNARKSNLRVVTKQQNLDTRRFAVARRLHEQDFREMARAMYGAGAPIRAIALGTGMSDEDIKRYCEGVTPPPSIRRTRRWTQDEIMEAFVSFQDHHGRLPTKRDLGTNGLPWHDTFCRYFPSVEDVYRELDRENS